MIPLAIFEAVSLGIIMLCVLVIFVAIFINFISRNMQKVKSEKRSIVETGTMTLFFLIFYLVIRFKFGVIGLNNLSARIALIILGLLIIIIGCIVNVKGRLALGRNWANQIKIYANQTFVNEGMYGAVRHPLYASLIWMFYGACLIYLNYTAFLLNTLIFIPFMYYRAKQEEKLLLKQFKNYKNYVLKVGMFFPKL